MRRILTVLHEPGKGYSTRVDDDETGASIEPTKHQPNLTTLCDRIIGASRAHMGIEFEPEGKIPEEIRQEIRRLGGHLDLRCTLCDATGEVSRRACPACEGKGRIRA